MDGQVGNPKRVYVSEDELILTDRTIARRRRGLALFKYGEHLGSGSVLFGEPGDTVLLGESALTGLGLFLDPLKRELMPLRLRLGGPRLRRTPLDLAE